jgi:hypothetical protein
VRTAVRIAVVVGFSITFLGVLASFVMLTLAGKDTTPLVMFASGAATSLLPQMLNYLKAHDTSQDVKALQSDMATVKDQTNGPLTRMSEQVNTLVRDSENGDKT